MQICSGNDFFSAYFRVNLEEKAEFILTGEPN